MKTSYFGVAAAIASVTQAYMIPSISNFEKILSDESNLENNHKNAILTKAVLESLAESNDTVILDAWEQMAKDLGSEKIVKLIEEYNSKKSNSKRLNNNYETFSDAPDPGFEHVNSDKHPNYTLRVRDTDPESLKLDTAKYYTGYLDIENSKKHFFYWFFESRNDPANDPIILWLSGGPGCSSSIGLFYEVGPCSIDSELKIVNNPNSWTNKASMIFLDQPVGTGYSYSEAKIVDSTAAGSKDMFAFLELFFQKFPHLSKNKFHLAGESYAGHSIPSLASEILSHSTRSFDVASVMIGNGWTDPVVQCKSFRPMACGDGGHEAILTPRACEQMDKNWPACEAIGKACYEVPSALLCIPASYHCDKKLLKPFKATGLDAYDIRYQRGHTFSLEEKIMTKFLNLVRVKMAVGASNVGTYSMCSDPLFDNFMNTGDMMKPFQGYVAELLNKKIPVLLFQGDKDFICNWLGNKNWANQLIYNDSTEFRAQKLIPWYTKAGQLAGEVQSHGVFTFLRVYDASHMMPHDKPEIASDMVNRWLSGDYAFQDKE